MTLTFDEPLKYSHLYSLQTIDGVTLEAAAEVGLLTRNVKVTGSINEDWTEYIEGCKKPFRAGTACGKKHWKYIFLLPIMLFITAGDGNDDILLLFIFPVVVCFSS